MPGEHTGHKTESSHQRLLFHGSPQRDLTLLRPSARRALHASDDIRLAVAFLARPEHCCCIRTNGAVHIWIAEDREAFRRRDRGGSIYVVDSNGFSPIRSNREPECFWEYTTNNTVTPLLRIDYASAFSAFAAHGVRVHFVAQRIFRNLDAANAWLSSISGHTVQAGLLTFASGILPLCRSTGRICLAWRSQLVQAGDCWGTIGGVVPARQSLRDSAIRELREETGYCGEIELHPAYGFAERSFQYQNFIGLVPVEFNLSPEVEHWWETVSLAWRHLDEWKKIMSAEPRSFHPGVVRLFRYADKLIESFVVSSPSQNTHQGFNSDSGRRSGLHPSETGTSYNRPVE
jgi:8-oxo-dGTP pyrophosphatase MutT (NUDIX family)